MNAVAHRDYAREGTDIEVSLYRDRFEVISPGRLPNGVTVEKMKEGVVRVARNELLKEILPRLPLHRTLRNGSSQPDHRLDSAPQWHGAGPGGGR